MSNAAEQFAALARRSQEATTTAVQDVTRALRSYTATVASRDPRPVDPQVAAAAGFELAEKLLHAQRDYVVTAIALFTAAGEAVSTQASAAGEAFVARTGQAAERVTDLTAAGARRAARNGVAV
jgi:hypothetical protein